MSDSKLKIIAGLGNPDQKYAKTRHNVGFLIVEALASQANISINKSGFYSKYVKTKIKGVSLFLVKPLTYMNRSGVSIHKFASYYKVAMEDIIIIHDDMDLEFGKIKIVKNRGHGGHNGIRSIIDAFGKKNCIRIRIGVGHPTLQKFRTQENITGHVLGNFSREEIKILDSMINTACDAALHILQKGSTSAMNLYNCHVTDLSAR